KENQKFRSIIKKYPIGGNRLASPNTSGYTFMTPRVSRRTSVHRTKYHDYIKVADNFYLGAELAKEFEYWNAAGVLIIHAAIAYTDAITIKVGGVKSQGEDHMAAVDLLREVVALDEAGKKASNHFARM